jgi:hypothetical protein
MLEQIVRPFQNPDVLSTRTIVASNRQVAVERARIVFGKSGAMPVPTVETSAGFRVANCNNTWKEKERQTHPQRVEQPDNPDNYVMIDVIDSIKFERQAEGERTDSPEPVFVAFARKVSSALATGWGNISTVDVCEDNFKLNNPAT